MNQTERFYKIEQILHDRRIASFAELQDELEISRATLKRDLQFLRDRLNAPIVYDREANGYRFDVPDRYAPKHQLPGLWFNASEIHALLMMQQLLEDVQPGLLGPHIAPLQTRLQSLLGSASGDGKNDADQIAKRVRILHAHKRRTELRHFELIASTLLKRRRLKIRHFNRGRNEESEREISPQRLVHYRDNWYLDAWCHLRKDVRSFAVDAIRSAELLDVAADEVKEEELNRVLAAGYGIFSGSDIESAKLRFTPEHARWVIEEQWHPQQKTELQKDGSLIMELPYANPTELVMDILRHGSGVEVLAPDGLRMAVGNELKAAAANY
ncbi:MAG TPA: YafY family protein [Rhodocyclaceae bacterium]|jgi:predicted DNA-binding transcriptional regulator YafY|nr:YafY family protein [Rhodocyclaceae bacterium]